MGGIPLAEFERFFAAGQRLEAVDCPIRFEVWRHYALWGPDVRTRLLVQRSSSASAMPTTGIAERINQQLGRHAERRIRPENTSEPGATVTVENGKNVGPDPSQAADQPPTSRRATAMGVWVFVSVDLSELIGVLLAGSDWSSVVTDLAQSSPAKLRLLLQRQTALDTTNQEHVDQDRGEPDLDDPQARTAWVGRLLARLWGYDPDVPWERHLASEHLLGHLGLTQAGGRTDSSIGESISSIDLDRLARGAVSRSRESIKADAASRLFSVNCSQLTWAVIDSGIDARHPAFLAPESAQTSGGVLQTRVDQAIDFTNVVDNEIDGLSDRDFVRHILTKHGIPLPRDRSDRRHTSPPTAHGTHVAGILGGSWTAGPVSVIGICPDINLWDLRVLDNEDTSPESRLLVALRYVRLSNEIAPTQRVHGVNLSLSIPYNPKSFSCGWTPVCDEVRRLVRSGVVVVAAAGNEGFEVGPEDSVTSTAGTGYRAIGITDPGNTEEAITVGATHRFSPHRHGASYFSSKGPTADGRMKPDLLAPGEGIRSSIGRIGSATKDGTSQAAPHVSGAAAILMAKYPELVGNPERVKQILCATATDLDRDAYFQGAGLVDVLRAVQSI